MDNRLICLNIINMLNKRHPCKVPTHVVCNDIDASKRSIQRQIKFLYENGIIDRHSGYKIGLKIDV